MDRAAPAPDSTVKHPAAYSPSVLEAFDDLLCERFPAGSRLLDPFAGTGRIHRLREDPLFDLRCQTIGVELEPEWAAMHPGTLVGDATRLPFPDRSIHMAATSPCLAVHERVLTADLRWVEAGAVAVGDRLLAFDELPLGRTEAGAVARRRWRIATVSHAGAATKRCVRVCLENGESVVCSWDHPWLTQRYRCGGNASEWTKAINLAGAGSVGLGKGHRKGKRQPYFVLKQLPTWEPNGSYEAGWLSGMMDGEGSLSFGVHGPPKLMITQNRGPVVDQVEKWLGDLGYKTNRIARRDSRVDNVYIVGGFPGIFRALGELRPTRLLSKLDQQLDVASRFIQPAYVRVVSVEEVGEKEIATLTTDTRTYIGEGYLHHNTYANRMADHHNARDGSYRRTYRHVLGRPLSTNNSGGMQWGDDYRKLHTEAWIELRRVLIPGGLFALNIKDHQRRGERVEVCAWHLDCLARLGFTLIGQRELSAAGFRYGQNHTARYPEMVYLLEAPGPLPPASYPLDAATGAAVSLEGAL